MSSSLYVSLLPNFVTAIKTEHSELNWMNMINSVKVELPEPESEPSLITPMSQVKVEEHNPDLIQVGHVTRKHVRFSNEQTAILMERFNKSRSLRNADWSSLILKTGLTRKQIKTWFGNRNAKVKKMKLENANTAAPAVNNFQVPPMPDLPVLRQPSPIIPNNLFLQSNQFWSQTSYLPFVQAVTASPTPVIQQTSHLSYIPAPAPAPVLQPLFNLFMSNIIQPVAHIHANGFNS